MEDRLSKVEIRKDALQETVESVASTVGEVASIITTAVKDVASAFGSLATDLFEIRDGARRASELAVDADYQPDAEPDEPDEPDEPVAHDEPHDAPGKEPAEDE